MTEKTGRPDKRVVFERRKKSASRSPPLLFFGSVYSFTLGEHRQSGGRPRHPWYDSTWRFHRDCCFSSFCLLTFFRCVFLSFFSFFFFVFWKFVLSSVWVIWNLYLNCVGEIRDFVYFGNLCHNVIWNFYFNYVGGIRYFVPLIFIIFFFFLSFSFPFFLLPLLLSVSSGCSKPFQNWKISIQQRY